VVVLDQDLPRDLHPGAAQPVREAGGQVLQQPAGVRPGIVHPGPGPGRVLAQADRPAVAAPPTRHRPGLPARAALCGRQPGQGQVEEPVRPPLLQQPVTEVAQHAVMETGIVELDAERVLEVDPAPPRLGGIAAGQSEQELQHAHRGQLRRPDPGTSVQRIQASEVLVVPEPVEPVPHPHRRRPGQIASPRHLRGQLRDPTVAS
jgi:hypothetical protein